MKRGWVAILIAVLSVTSGCAWLKAAPGNELLKSNCEGREIEPVPVGVLLPLSGKYQWYGDAALSGIRLGVEGTDGLRLVVRDTEGDPQRAVRELEDLVERERVVAVIGPMFTDEVRAAAEKAQDLEVPLLVLNGSADIARTGPYVFRNFLTHKAQVELLVRYATEALKVQRFAVVHPEDHYGRTYLELFQSEVERHQGVVVQVESYPVDTTNFATPIRKLVGRHDLEKRPDFVAQRDRIKRRYRKDPLQRDRELKKLAKTLPPIVGFEAIFVPDVYEKVALFGPALAYEDVILKSEDPQTLDRIRKAMGRKDLDLVYLLGTEGWNHPKLVEWAGRYLPGAVFTDGFFQNSNREATRSFVEAYRARFGKDPERLSALGYDNALILKTLFEQTPPCSTAELKDALLDLRDFDGATGPTSFGPDGDARKELFLLTIRGGAIVEVAKPPVTS